MTEAKLCRMCGPEHGPLPLSAFWRCAAALDGYRGTCKSCSEIRWPRNRTKRARSPKVYKVQGEELELILRLHKEGLIKRDIAKQVGRARQTVSGVIQRYTSIGAKEPRTTHAKTASSKPDDDHPSKQPRGKIKPGDELWPVEAAMMRDRRALKLLDERRKRLRAEWLSYRT